MKAQLLGEVVAEVSVAQYFDVLAAGSRIPAAAWSYRRPLPTARTRVGADFSDYVAFDAALVDVG